MRLHQGSKRLQNHAHPQHVVSREKTQQKVHGKLATGCSVVAGLLSVPSSHKPEYVYGTPSASALSQFRLCQARAIGRYVAGIKEPFGGNAAKGVVAHGLTQDFMSKGSAVPSKHKLAGAVRRAVALLPVGAGEIEPHNIERAVLMSHHGVSYIGYLDYEDPHALHTRYPVQGDLKFTSSLRHLNAKDWLKDDARIIYAHDWFYRNGPSGKLISQWTGSQFNGKAAKNYKLKFTALQARRLMNDVVAPVADKLLNACATKRDWQDMPKNYDACDLYPPHGCVMREHGCKKDLKKLLFAIRPKQAKVS